MTTTEEIDYENDPQWSDVNPIDQDDGPGAVVCIMYSQKFVVCMNYFRAVLKADEQSARALRLTESVIGFNAANYTAWHFRRQCLFALGSDLDVELRFVEAIALNSPKNYQLWHHRRVLVDRLNRVGCELEHTKQVLLLDAKNYHVWSHRQWVLQRFFGDGDVQWQRELGFVDNLIDEDVRNNSAWSQRHYVVSHESSLSSSGKSGKSDEMTEDDDDGFSLDADGETVQGSGVAWTSSDIVARELLYAQGQLKKTINNESAWNYIRGVSYKRGFNREHLAALVTYIHSVSPESAVTPPCVPALALLLDLYGRPFPGQRDELFGAQNIFIADAADKDMRRRRLRKAIAICDDLVRHDSIREEFWIFERSSMQQMLAGITP